MGVASSGGTLESRAAYQLIANAVQMHTDRCQFKTLHLTHTLQS